MNKVNISHLVTESRNPKTMNLDDMSIHEFLTVMNEEDALVPQRIHDVLPQIEKAVEKIVEALNLRWKTLLCRQWNKWTFRNIRCCGMSSNI